MSILEQEQYDLMREIVYLKLHLNFDCVLLKNIKKS